MPFSEYLGLLLAFLSGSTFMYLFMKFKKGSAKFEDAIEAVTSEFAQIFKQTGEIKKLSANQQTNSSKIVEQAQTLEELAKKGNTVLESSTKSISEFHHGMQGFENVNENFKKLVEGLTQNVNALGKDSRNMKKIEEELSEVNSFFDTLDQITFSARILSFNASIEAARSSADEGSGFGVVAKEIKILAERTDDSSKQIKDAFDAAFSQIRESNKNMTVDINQVLQNTQLMQERFLEFQESIENIVSGIKDVIHSQEAFSQEFTSMVYVANNVMSSSEDNFNSSKSISELGDKLQTYVENQNKSLSELVGLFRNQFIEDIAPEVAHQQLDKYDLILDVRRDEEFVGELGHIAGSKLLTISPNFSDDMNQYESFKKKKILFVCRSGGRSARAARLASNSGFKYVFNLEGGMLEWNAKKLPIKSENASSLDHVAA